MATYRLLRQGDRFEEGDEFTKDGFEWTPVPKDLFGEIFERALYMPHRRKTSDSDSLTDLPRFDLPTKTTHLASEPETVRVTRIQKGKTFNINVEIRITPTGEED